MEKTSFAFTKEELVYYSRQLMLPGIGISGQQKLKQAKVLVIGAGGLGCPVLQYLAAAGVGTVGVIDFDVIELHNLHRQILYTMNDVGKSKADAATEKLKALNPYNNYKAFNTQLNSENAISIISNFDMVIDGCDNFETRYIVNDACTKLHKPLVYGSIFKFEGQVAVFNYQGSKNLRDLYPEAPNPEDVPNCSETGVIGSVVGMTGSMMCLIAIDIILEKFTSINTLHLMDVKNFSIMKLNF